MSGSTTPSSNGTTIPPLRQLLSCILPKEVQYSLRYIHSKPKRCEPLFSPLPNSQPEKTTLTSHFLTVSVDREKQEVFAYAVEVLVYSTSRLTTFFVSKADSTGYLDRAGSSVIRPTTRTFLRWLSDLELERRPRRRQVVSLFGRAQGQYLFPGSAENPKKHVLDDRQLIKWWARTLTPLLSHVTTDGEHSTDVRQGYITVPGYRGFELRKFMPDPESEEWLPGHPLLELAAVRGVPEHAPTRCLLPRFPDDPKARYMQDLDDEVGLAEDAGSSAVTISPTKRRNARWKVIHDLDRFWDGMEFRQECSSGRDVGFLWVVIAKHSKESQVSSQMTSTQDFSQLSDPEMYREKYVPQSAPKKKRKLTGPITCRPARPKGSNRTGQGSVNTFDGNGLRLTADGYDQAMQTLLHLDFANLDVAAKSTRKWIMEVSSTSGLPKYSWALNVKGMVESYVRTPPSTSGTVNDLGATVRKKKRSLADAEPDMVSSASTAPTPPVVNVLSAGLIRKKPKT